MNFLDGKKDVKLNYSLLKEDLASNVDKLNDFDKWMLSSLNSLISETETYYEKFML